MIITKFLTRAQVAQFYECSHIELRSLLCQKRCPLPVKPVAGEPGIFWHADEIEGARAEITSTLTRWRRNTRRAA